MEPWFFLEHGRCAPAWNMACDQWLLRNAQKLEKPVLRTYGWDRPSVSIGYFQDYPVDIVAFYTVVRRPTGGALVMHDADLTYTVALPSGHPWKKLGVCERYTQVHRRVGGVFEKRGFHVILASSCSSSAFTEATEDKSAERSDAKGSGSLSPAYCFSKSSRYDVMLDGVKVAGGAQRVTRDGLIHQGSIQGEGQWRVSTGELRDAWERCGAHFEKLILSPGQHAEIRELVASQFGTPEWNRHRMFHQSVALRKSAG